MRYTVNKPHSVWWVGLWVVMGPVWALEAPTFSHSTGFYEQPIQLHLSHPDPEVTIYYTLDGSEPDVANLSGSTYRYKNNYAQYANQLSSSFLYRPYQTHIYGQPLAIHNRRTEADVLAHIATTAAPSPDYFPNQRQAWVNQLKGYYNRGVKNANRLINRVVFKVKDLIGSDSTHSLTYTQYLPFWAYSYNAQAAGILSKGTTVRAIAHTTEQSSPIATHTYMVAEPLNSLATVFISAPEPLLYGYDQGLLVAGQGYEHHLAQGANPWDNLDLWPMNWAAKEPIAAHIAYVPPQQALATAASDAGMRTHGLGSKLAPNKSLRFYLEAGAPLGLAADLFNDAQPIGTDRLILRNNGNGGINYLKDGVYQQLMQGLAFGVQRYAPVHSYINAQYNGLLNARDRLDKYYLRTHFGLPTTKVDLIKVTYPDAQQIAQHGSTQDWDALMAQLATADTQAPEFLPWIQQHLDITSFLDYYIAQIYLDNDDWPLNNMRYWRYRGTKKHPLTATGYTDGRWRWLMYDIDAAGGRAANIAIDRNALTRLTQSTSEHSPIVLFQTLLANPQIQQQFIQRFSDLLNTQFKAERAVAFVEQARTRLEPAMPGHIQRWGQPDSMKQWHQSVDQLTTFAQQRPDYQWQHLAEYFGLGAPVDVQLSLNLPTSGQIQLNSLRLAAGPNTTELHPTPIAQYLQLPWQGQYLVGQTIEITAIPAAGYKFSHWQAAGLNAEQAAQPKLTMRLQADIQLEAVMEPVE